MKGGSGMHRVLGMAVLIMVFALGAGLTLPARVQAGGAPLDPAEKQKIIDLLKLQIALSMGEHTDFHNVLEKLSKKYPNDPDVKALSDDYHSTMHKRMTAQEQTADVLMKTYLSSTE